MYHKHERRCRKVIKIILIYLSNHTYFSQFKTNYLHMKDIACVIGFITNLFYFFKI